MKDNEDVFRKVVLNCDTWILGKPYSNHSK